MKSVFAGVGCGSAMGKMERPGTKYEIREFRSEDRPGFLSLYEDVFGERNLEYFEWRFYENPYVSEPPIHVAIQDGELVGGRASLPIDLLVDGRRVRAIMQVDPMVHPDHRGRGLFTRMAEAVYDQYAPTDVQVSIGFPNGVVKSALEGIADRLSIDAGLVEPLPHYYRIQRPTALVDDDTGAAYALARIAAPVADSYLDIRDRLATQDGEHGTTEIHIDQYPGSQPSVLAEIATTGPQDGIHAVRDEEFYRWRFDNPYYDYITYVGRLDGEPVASLTAGTRVDESTTITHLSDVQPIGGQTADGEDRTDVIARLLGRLVTDHRGADLIAATGSAIPTDLLTSYGFHDDTKPPLDRLTSENYFIARPVAEQRVRQWSIGSVRPGDLSNWRLSFCEREIG